MQNIKLKEFQVDTIERLVATVEKGDKEIILKSPTGSGKTVMLCNFVNEYNKRNSGCCFVWLTPGKGNLEEQSKNKMNSYFPLAETKLLNDILSAGFTENSISFINWELVTKKGNNALVDSERDNLKDKIRKAKFDNLSFILIVD